MKQPRLQMMVAIVALVLPLSGCTGLTGMGGCGEGYEEMYGGYDYVYDTKVVDSQNNLTVILELVNGGGGWLEEGD